MLATDVPYFHFFFIDNLVPYARFTEVQRRRENEPENAEFKCNFVVDFFNLLVEKKGQGELMIWNKS